MSFPVIICVDDEPMILQSLEFELSESLKGDFDVEFAQSGVEALELLNELLEDKIEIPLVISDFIMPEMKGDELLSKIHKLSPDTLCVMLTGQSTIEGVVQAINNANLYRYIHKPWEKEDLLLTVKEALAKYDQNLTIKRQHESLSILNRELEQKVEERTEQLQKQSEHLQIKNSELERQKSELKELNQVKDKLFSIISHDLKGPLNSLRAVLNLVSRGGISADEIQMLTGSLNERVEQSYHLLENLLNWARNQMTGQFHSPAYLDMHQIAEQTVSLLNKMAEDKEVKLSHQVPRGFTVFADSDMMELILRNLISNAIKFTESGDSITITAQHQDDSFIQISVADTGKGIEEDKIPTLFSMQEQFTTKGTAEETGTGLGLSLCKDCVDKNGGRIWVESQLGEGTTFHYTIPKNPESSEE